MIFVTVGTQEFQFNRLLKEIDRLLIDGSIQEKVFAQRGFTDYKPVNYDYVEFMDSEEFEGKLDECRLLITHGGTGSIIGALRRGKKVIGIPRLSHFGEHIDDHQIELLEMFSDKGYIVAINDVIELEMGLDRVEEFKPVPYISGNKKIVEIITDYIDNIL